MTTLNRRDFTIRSLFAGLAAALMGNRKAGAAHGPTGSDGSVPGDRPMNRIIAVPVNGLDRAMRDEIGREHRELPGWRAVVVSRLDHTCLTTTAFIAIHYAWAPELTRGLIR